MNLKIRKTKSTTINRIIINLGSTNIINSPILYSFNIKIIITTSPYLINKGSDKKIGMDTHNLIRIMVGIMCRILKLSLLLMLNMEKRRVLFWLSNLLLSVWSARTRKIMFPRAIPYLINRDRDKDRNIRIWLKDKRNRISLWFRNRWKRRRVELQIRIRFNISQNLR